MERDSGVCHSVRLSLSTVSEEPSPQIQGHLGKDNLCRSQKHPGVTTQVHTTQVHARRSPGSESARTQGAVAT